MLSDEAKKIFLAGIGAAAITAEKSKKMVEELVKKGELTVEQGKVLNEELKHKASQKAAECAKARQEGTVPANVEGVERAIDRMTPEELQQVKAKITEKENTTPSGGKGSKANTAGE